MGIRHLKTLLAIAEHGSFGAAAGALNLTPSAVSHQMRALEDELGAELFDRSTRPPELTSKGRALLPRARAIVALYDRLAEATSAADDLAGALEIGAVPTILSGLLPRALAALKASHPRIHVRVRRGLSAELLSKVRHGDIDAAVIVEPPEQRGSLVWRPFAREPFVVIAPRGAPGETDRALLESLPYIRYNRKAWTGRLIQKSLRDRGITVKEGMELDSLEAISLMVHHGLGVSVVPRRSATDLAELDLKRVPFGQPPLYRTLGLIERPRHARARLTSAFRQELAQLRWYDGAV